MARIIILILLHILGDFILQSKRLSILKRTKIPALFQHTAIYTMTFLLLSSLWLSLTFVQGIVFGLLNGVIHLIIDYITGLLKKKYWSINEAKYITIVGLDQVVHIIILIVTYLTLYPGILNVPTIFDKY